MAEWFVVLLHIVEKAKAMALDLKTLEICIPNGWIGENDWAGDTVQIFCCEFCLK